MDTLNFHLDQPLRFNWTGKFIAPDENWVHMSRMLEDFELILMTKGDLYIAEDNKEYVVHEGEYIILSPPLSPARLPPVPVHLLLDALFLSRKPQRSAHPGRSLFAPASRRDPDPATGTGKGTPYGPDDRTAQAASGLQPQLPEYQPEQLYGNRDPVRTIQPALPVRRPHHHERG